MSTPSSIILDIETALTARVKADGGIITKAADEDHAMQLLAEAPNRWRLILLWDGHGSHELAINGMTAAKISTFISMNMGLSHHIGNKIYEGDEAFTARMEEFRKSMQALRWQEGHQVDPKGVSLEGSSWATNTPSTHRSHGLTWNLNYALEGPEEIILIPAP